MVNGPKKVYVEKGGKLLKSPIAFDDDDGIANRRPEPRDHRAKAQRRRRPGL